MVFNIELTDIEGNELDQGNLEIYIQVLVRFIDPKMFLDQTENGVQVNLEAVYGPMPKLIKLSDDLVKISKVFSGALVALYAPYQEFGFKMYYYGGRMQVCKQVKSYEPINLVYLMGMEE